VFDNRTTLDEQINVSEYYLDNLTKQSLQEPAKQKKWEEKGQKKSKNEQNDAEHCIIKNGSKK
jgi:hypothetical protein